jgi:hypothetical protein
VQEPAGFATVDNISMVDTNWVDVGKKVNGLNLRSRGREEKRRYLGKAGSLLESSLTNKPAVF